MRLSLILVLAAALAGDYETLTGPYGVLPGALARHILALDGDLRNGCALPTRWASDAAGDGRPVDTVEPAGGGGVTPDRAPLDAAQLAAILDPRRLGGRYRLHPPDAIGPGLVLIEVTGPRDEAGCLRFAAYWAGRRAGQAAVLGQIYYTDDRAWAAGLLATSADIAVAYVEQVPA